MRIAVEGCSHGCLDQIYANVLALDKRDNKVTDLVILCGDVQTLRNHSDLHCLAVPDKYKQMGDFHRYYADAFGQSASNSQDADGSDDDGKRKRIAPYLTIMIGGNHEASNYLWELYYGGWVAPNIYYLGAAGCIEVGGLVIAGISGIYKSHDYALGRHERMPYNPGSIRSIYHTRCFDTFRLHMLAAHAKRGNGQDARQSTPMIVLSHDWPNTIEEHGDTQWLLRKKPFFREEISNGCLGSPPLFALLCDLKPRYWFSAHLHVKFAAIVKHEQQVYRGSGIDNINGRTSERAGLNQEEIEIDIDDDSEGGEDAAANVVEREAASSTNSQGPHSQGHEPRETRFLALSKCLEGQDFLQMLDIVAPCDTEERFRTKVSHTNPYRAVNLPSSQPSIRFHAPWLAVLRSTDRFLSLEKQQTALPSLGDEQFHEAIERDWRWIKDRHDGAPRQSISDTFGDDDTDPYAIRRVQRFTPTAPAATNSRAFASHPPSWYTNPQTVALCEHIGIKNRINAPPEAAVQTEAPFPPALVPPQAQSKSAAVLEQDEIKRIEEAARAAMERQAKADAKVAAEAPPLCLDDDEDEAAARWKEGTG